MFLNRISATLTLALGIAGLFLGECLLFHFPLGVGADALWLMGLTLLPGIIVVLLFRHGFGLELKVPEILSLGGAIGFGLPPFILGILHDVGITNGLTIYYFFRIAIALILFLLIVLPKLHFGLEGKVRTINYFLLFAIGALFLFAASNLQGFQFQADGSILTRGLFGTDLPFLAGEIHGLRNFGTLQDLHQMAEPWHYHDWTYQLLALFPSSRTLPDLALAAPLVGYTLLSFSLFTLVLTLTKRSYVAIISVPMWFLAGGLGNGELLSYALSPSFVFGSMILLNVLLTLDLRTKEIDPRRQWVYIGILLCLLLELSQTKLSSAVVGIGALGLIAVLLVKKERMLSLQLLMITIVVLLLIFFQNGANPLMPGNDFLIGAPLLGYANHLAAVLHLPVSTLNPVSHGLALRWQTLLIIPFFVFHLVRFVTQDPKLLCAAIVLGLFRKELWNGYGIVTRMLVLSLPIGFLLPVLYSPAWYPLALSFYAPLVSTQSALLLSALAFGMLASHPEGRRTKAIMGLVAAIYLAAVAFGFRSIMDENSSKPRVISSSLVHTMEFLQRHTNEHDRIATHRWDLDSAGDESFYWYSALSGRTIVSEGAKYGSLLAAVADTNAEKGLHPVEAAKRVLAVRRILLDTVYESHYVGSVLRALHSLNASYVLETADQRLSVDPTSLGRLTYSEPGIWVWSVAPGP